MKYPKLTKELDKRISVGANVKEIKTLRKQGHSLRFIARELGYKSHKDIIIALMSPEEKKEYNLKRSIKRWNKIKSDPELHEKQKEALIKHRKYKISVQPEVIVYDNLR